MARYSISFQTNYTPTLIIIMIARLTGHVTHKLANGTVIINVGGIGFGVRTNAQTEINQEIALLIYEHIREDAYDLFGFSSEADLLVFKQLVSISGVGPKIAMIILERGSASDLKKVIETGNVDYFQTIHGIGKKMAQKIILELQSKIGQESDLGALLSESHQDLKAALESLGYKAKEFSHILRNLPPELKTTQKQLTWVLQQIGK